VIECQIEDGVIVIRTDDTGAEAAKLADALKGSEWADEFDGVKMVDGKLEWKPSRLDVADVDDPASTTARFFEIVELEPDDVVLHYDPSIDYDGDEDEF
jgi:hypothetical protein